MLILTHDQANVTSVPTALLVEVDTNERVLSLVYTLVKEPRSVCVARCTVETAWTLTRIAELVGIADVRILDDGAYPPAAWQFIAARFASIPASEIAATASSRAADSTPRDESTAAADPSDVHVVDFSGRGQQL